MESIWKQTAERPERFEIGSVSDVEAVVIGAGMAGILIAWFLQQQGMKTIVLEADVIGSGQTGNTTAKVTSQHGLIYEKLIRTVGERKALQYASANEEAIGDYKKIIQEHKIECAWEESSAYLYCTENADMLKREAESAKKFGIQADFVADTSLPFPVTGAVRFQNQAHFHPLRFLYALAKQLPVYEHSPVIRIEKNRIVTKHGGISAKYIIFATHYPFINRPGYYFMRMHQERSYAAAMKGAEQLHGMYLGIDGDELSFRNFGGMILIGGAGHRTGENHTGGQYEMLRKKALQYWPGCEAKAYWSAQDCMTLDGIPYIGQFSAKTPHWYVATGFGKWGMTGSMAAARLISDEIMQRENKNKEVFSPQRVNAFASAKNFVKDGICSVKGLSRRIFESPKQGLEQLQNGHGGIVEYDREKVGAYKDDDGTVFIVSIKCPHLGCQLEWNPEEKTWDCPCHGSRFDYKGNVIDNPAQEGAKHVSL